MTLSITRQVKPSDLRLRPAASVMLSFGLFLLLPATINGSHVINLTGANYEQATSGRTVFLKVGIFLQM